MAAWAPGMTGGRCLGRGVGTPSRSVTQFSCRTLSHTRNPRWKNLPGCAIDDPLLAVRSRLPGPFSSGQFSAVGGGSEREGLLVTRCQCGLDIGNPLKSTDAAIHDVGSKRVFLRLRSSCALLWVYRSQKPYPWVCRSHTHGFENLGEMHATPYCLRTLGKPPEASVFLERCLAVSLGRQIIVGWHICATARANSIQTPQRRDAGCSRWRLLICTTRPSKNDVHSRCGGLHSLSTSSPARRGD